MSKAAEWNKQFNIGVASIDHAHQKLFSIVRKLIYLSEDEHNGQWACAEGIKYFRNYAMEHFSDEEDYMRSIGYGGFEIHKRLHDDMRYKTLPALERDLLESNYSQESIHHFLGICLGWLTAHIMIEDRAITGEISNKWKTDHTKEDTEALEDALADTVQKLFGLQTEIVSEHYSGEHFGNSIIDRLTYRTKDGKLITIFLILEESLVLQAVSSMLDMPLKKVDKLVMNTVRQISQQIAVQIGTHFPLLSAQYQSESNHTMTEEQFLQEYLKGSYDYSLLFNTGNGYFAFCITPG